jgi:integrase
MGEKIQGKQGLLILPNKTPYTAEVYAGYLKTHILPTWAKHSLSDVKTVAVEAWLKTLKLAPGTKAKLRNLMHALYNHAMRLDLTNRNPITFVRQSAKRTRVPDVLTAEEIGRLLGELAERGALPSMWPSLPDSA